MTNGTPKSRSGMSKRPGAHTSKKALFGINARIDRANDKIRALRVRVAILELELLPHEENEDEAE